MRTKSFPFYSTENPSKLLAYAQGEIEIKSDLEQGKLMAAVNSRK